MKSFINVHTLSLFVFLINSFGAYTMDLLSVNNQLYHACGQLDNLEKVKQLLSAGANPNATHSIMNEPPLFRAARSGNEKAVRLLVEAGAEVNTKNSINHATPLHSAVYMGHLSTVLALIESKADVNAQDKAGITPMHAAALDDKVDIGKLLLQYNADTKGTSKKWQKKLIDN